MSHVDGVDDGVGYGVFGRSPNGSGVFGRSNSGEGVVGNSNSGEGVVGNSNSGEGVVGRSNLDEGVVGISNTSGDGVRGQSDLGSGVNGRSKSGHGVFGESRDGDGVRGWSQNDVGVSGYSDSDSGGGVYGEGRFLGVNGYSPGGVGVFGGSYTGAGVDGFSGRGYGVVGHTHSGYGVYGGSVTSDGYAAYLDGRVHIVGPFTKPGGSFKIDHPLDPANKYLSHSFVESPDMKNVYDGVVVLNDNGEAVIVLPDWFGSLNKDFRYQLTAIGAPGPNLYIADEISDGVTKYSNSNSNHNSSFKIAGGTSGMKVSWQVTGKRHDPWANVNRIKVEEDKSAEEQGYYLYPDLYGKAAEKGISRLLFPTEEEEEKQELLLIDDEKKLI
jgi:hypothetical protein